MRKSRIAIVGLLLTFLAVKAQANPRIHAAMVYQFAIKSVFPSSGDFVIGVVGSTPTKAELDNLAKARTINGRKIVVKTFSSASAITKCDLIYVPKSQGKNIAAISAKAKSFKAMVVSDNASDKSSVNLNFIIKDGKPRFEMNKARLESHGIKPSADLVKLAIPVS